MIKQAWAHKMQAKYETQKPQNVYWYFKRNYKFVIMPFLKQIRWIKIVLGNTIQINLRNIFFKKLRRTEVAKNKWREEIILEHDYIVQSQIQ